MFDGQEAEPEKLDKINEALQYLNQFLEDQDWVAGDSMTIADISVVVTVSNSEVRGVVSLFI
jgi:glutathione S-transferase